MNLVKKFEQIPPYIHPKDHRFFVFCNSIFIYALFAHIIFVPIFYQTGNIVVLIVNTIAIFVDIFCLRLNNKGFNKLAPFIWIFWVSVHSLNCMSAFGWQQGYYYYLLSLVIVVFYSRWAISSRLIITTTLCIATILMFEYTYTHPPITKLDHQAQLYMHAFNAIANFLGVAYASFYYRKYYEEMEDQLLTLAHTDALTGIWNRRFFEQSVKSILENTSSATKECALLVLDIDYFKSINDSYGHAVGDEVLQKVVEVIKHSLREGDILGRVGGEEFAFLLIDVEHSQALQIAERVRKNIENNKFILGDATQISLSVSIGLTIKKTKNENLLAMMVRSDKALYQAKNSGRNRIVFFE